MADLIAAIIVLIIVLIIIVILVVPFQISMELFRQGTINQGYIRVKWLKIRIIERKLIQPPEKEKKPKRKFDINKLIEMLPEIIEEIIPRFITSLPTIINIQESFLRSISIERISLITIIGLGDSVDTALLGGFLYSVAAAVNIFPNIYFSVEPDLINARLEGSLDVSFKFRLLWVTAEFLKALTNKPFRSLLWELRKMRGLFV